MGIRDPKLCERWRKTNPIGNPDRPSPTLNINRWRGSQRQRSSCCTSLNASMRWTNTRDAVPTSHRVNGEATH
ncbi:hypothetical protein BHE74_00011991 [Ensete ventricosum]|nr:hypothetical protein GW17_00029494 [Ensete ventricosum]RWW79704.1 hypothetical protein BHE74_00011991 [Ensete ventricosum]RZR91881.1 hypothetical protein BHM03_00020072 [Ensete ventricosum]